MERHERKEACVIPIILRPVSAWKDTPFGKLQVLPPEARAVTSRSWKDQDEAFYYVAEGIREVIKEIPPDKPRVALPPLNKPFQISSSNLVGWISSIAWSPDGKYIASGGSDKAVHIFDLELEKKVKPSKS